MSHLNEPLGEPPSGEPGNPPSAPRSVILWSLRTLAAVGLLCSAYLAWSAITEQKLAGCGNDSFIDCDAVLSSRWSTVGSMPVSLPACSLYASLLVALCFSGCKAPAPLQRASLALAAVLVSTAAASGLWFIALQAIAVGKVCKWCLVVHTCSLVLAFLFFSGITLSARLRIAGPVLGIGAAAILALAQWILPQPDRFEIVSSGEQVAQASLTFGAGPATAPLSAESTNQVATNPTTKPTTNPTTESTTDPVTNPTTEPAAESTTNPTTNPTAEPAAESATKSAAEPPLVPSSENPSSQETRPANLPTPPEQTPTQSDQPNPVSESPPPQTAIPPNPPSPPEQKKPPVPTSPKKRVIKVLSGKVQLNVYDVPHWGNPEAPQVVVKLFDYTCLHCRTMHHFLQQAAPRYGDQLVVVLLPVPLNKKCNSYMRVSLPEHAQACELAKYALAVYRVRPDRFAQFDAYLSNTRSAPSGQAARAEAAKLIGETALARELAHRDLDQQLQNNIELYASPQYCGGGTLPKLLFPASVQRGTMTSAPQLFHVLEKELRLTPLPNK